MKNQNRHIKLLLLTVILYMNGYYITALEGKTISDFIITDGHTNTEKCFKNNNPRKLIPNTIKDSAVSLANALKKDLKQIIEYDELLLIVIKEADKAEDADMKQQLLKGTPIPSWWEADQQKKLKIIENLKKEIESLKADCAGSDYEKIYNDILRYKNNHSILGHVPPIDYTANYPLPSIYKTKITR